MLMDEVIYMFKGVEHNFFRYRIRLPGYPYFVRKITYLISLYFRFKLGSLEIIKLLSLKAGNVRAPS